MELKNCKSRIICTKVKRKEKENVFDMKYKNKQFNLSSIRRKL